MDLCGYSPNYVAQCEGMHFVTGSAAFLLGFSAAYWLSQWMLTTCGMAGGERLTFSLSLSSGLFCSALSHLLADDLGWGW